VHLDPAALGGVGVRELVHGLQQDEGDPEQGQVLRLEDVGPGGHHLPRVRGEEDEPRAEAEQPHQKDRARVEPAHVGPGAHEEAIGIEQRHAREEEVGGVPLDALRALLAHALVELLVLLPGFELQHAGVAELKDELGQFAEGGRVGVAAHQLVVNRGQRLRAVQPAHDLVLESPDAEELEGNGILQYIGRLAPELLLRDRDVVPQARLHLPQEGVAVVELQVGAFFPGHFRRTRS
jgi:hypothetical protein